MIAHHVIFTADGFWLPNDPRGSCSDFVAAWELVLAAGKATRVNTTRSVARVPHDRTARLKAKESLQFPPVHFDDRQIAAIAEGFAHAVSEGRYEVFECSIMAEHVHMVIRHSPRDIKVVIGHLKQRASMRLYELRLHPFDGLKRPGGRAVSCWAEHGWSAFMDTPDDLRRAIDYVRQNPLKAGGAAQHWSFVREFGSNAR